AGTRCPKPVHIDKLRVDAYLDEKLREVAAGTSGLDLIGAQRRLGEAKKRLDAAADDLAQYQLRTAAMSANLIGQGMRGRVEALEEAQAVPSTLVDQAESAAEFPTSAEAWDALTLDKQRQNARHVIEKVTVAPFTGRASKKSDVESRLDIGW